jgi:hypothetical protein
LENNSSSGNLLLMGVTIFVVTCRFFGCGIPTGARLFSNLSPVARMLQRPALAPDVPWRSPGSDSFPKPLLILLSILLWVKAIALLAAIVITIDVARFSRGLDVIRRT